MIEKEGFSELSDEIGQLPMTLCEHKGLIRGTVIVGARQDGEPITRERYWYPCGRMSPGRAGQ